MAGPGGAPARGVPALSLPVRLAVWDDWALGLIKASPQPGALESWNPIARRELARECLQEALRSAPRAAERGRLLRLLGRDAEARAVLEAAARRPAASEEARLWLAELLVATEPERALTLLLPLKSPVAALVRGLCALRLRRNARAAADFSEAAEGLERPFPAALLLGLALHRAGRPLEALSVYDRTPDEAAARDWLAAYAAHDAGEYQEARRYVGQALRRYPEAALDRLLGLPCYGGVLAPPRRTLEWFERGAVRGPYRTLALALRGMLWASPRFSRYRESAAEFARAVRLDPDAAWLHAYLGRALENIGEHVAARESLDQAVRLAPESGWILAWRGCLRYRRGEHGAIADLDRAVRLSPAYGFARAWRGGALRLLGRHQPARRELELAVRLIPIYEWCYAELFQVCRAQRRYAEAAHWLTEAFEREPKFVWRPWRRAEFAAACRASRKPLLRAWHAFSLLQEGDAPAAARALGRPGASAPAISWFTLGQLAAARGDAKTALRAFSRAVTLRRAAPYLRARGELLWRLGRLTAAVRDLEAAVAANGTVAAALWLLAAARLEREGARQALPFLDRALGLSADYPEALALRAEALRRLGRPGAARREAARALALREDGPWALAVLARLARDPVEAAGLWRRALERQAEVPARVASAWSGELRLTLARAERLVRPCLKSRPGPAALERLRRLSPAFWSALTAGKT